MVRHCGHCGAPFDPVNDTHRFCSARCRLMGWAVRHADRELDLFAGAEDAVDDGMAARDAVANREQDALDRLVPLARKLAAARGSKGITVSDVRLAAEEEGLPLPENLMALGGLMKRAGLVRTDRMRPSPIRSTHGRPQVVWVNRGNQP